MKDVKDLTTDWFNEEHKLIHDGFTMALRNLSNMLYRYKNDSKLCERVNNMINKVTADFTQASTGYTLQIKDRDMQFLMSLEQPGEQDVNQQS